MAKVTQRTRIVHAVHPSPILHVPRGCRVERWGFERLVTPVGLTTVPDSELVEAPAAAAAMGLPLHAAHYGSYVVRDAVWVSLRLRNNGRGPLTAIDPHEFAGFLDASRPDVGNRLAAVMRWTPVVACWQSPTQADAHHLALGRGTEMTPAKLGRVVSEERARSVSNVTEYLEGSVLLTPTRVLVRMVPCARMQGGTPESVLVPRTGGEETWSLPCRHDLVPDAARVWCLGKALAPHDTGPLAFGARLGGDGLDDLVAGANILARKVDALLERLPEEGGWQDGRGPADLRAVRAEYDGWCMRGRIGSVGLDDADRFLAAFALLPDRLAEVVRPGPVVEGLGRFVRHVERIYLPRLRTVALLTDEDLSTLEGIGA